MYFHAKMHVNSCFNYTLMLMFYLLKGLLQNEMKMGVCTKSSKIRAQRGKVRLMPRSFMPLTLLKNLANTHFQEIRPNRLQA